MNIFISSTYIDCISYRKAAVEAINYLCVEKINIIGMELFGARKKTTLEVCLEEVSKADIYILIVAHRYGTIDESTQKSYTQLEYEKIVKKDIPILVYFLDKSVPVLPDWVDKDFKYIKLSEFKRELGKKHTFQTFYNVDDLKYKIVNDLSRELNLNSKHDIDFYSDDIDLTPGLYNNHEILISFILVPNGIGDDPVRKVIPQIAEKLNLVKGNALESNINIIKDNKELKYSTLICQGIFTQWLKSAWFDKQSYLVDYDKYRIAHLFQAKIKIVYTTYKELDFDGVSQIYIDKDFVGVLLLEMPKKIGEFRETINVLDDWDD